MEPRGQRRRAGIRFFPHGGPDRLDFDTSVSKQISFSFVWNVSLWFITPYTDILCLTLSA